MRQRRITRAVAGSAILLLAGTLAPAVARAAGDCAHWTPTRQVFFGDLHVHTDRSFDAAAYGTRNGPRDAYLYARGGTIGLPPYDAFGAPTRTHALRRPLDFAAVTDHAEMFGETSLCTSGSVQDPACLGFQIGNPNLLFVAFASQLFSPTPTRQPFCGPGDLLCLNEGIDVWADLQLAAAEFDVPDGDCRFTTFNAYEWTGPGAHRNVVFRNERVPASALSYVEAPSVPALWQGLVEQCVAVGGPCEALTIPHNSNFGFGQSFVTTEPDGSPLGVHTAALGASLEPLVEILQHKGDSECEPGIATSDPTCDFEKLDLGGPPATPPLSYVRNVLKEGLDWQATIGVNPYRYGMIASTDTHNGAPGAAEEDDFVGHAGARDDTLEGRLAGGWGQLGPGGLVAIWAEENGRDALFDAMKRREAYATSGTRPSLRVFGGLDLPSGLCQSTDLAASGYALGVPMGGELVATTTGTAFDLVVAASQDPGAPGFAGTPLAEIQVVKGWRDATGATHEETITIAGGPAAPGALDPTTCATDGSGFADVCVEWRDPDFDPEQNAFYYVRALESPVCRWHRRQCVDAGVDCSTPAPAGLEACCDGSLPDGIQERATSSPIWVTPVPEPGFGSALALGLLGGLIAGAPARRRADGNVRPDQPRAPSNRSTQRSTSR